LYNSVSKDIIFIPNTMSLMTHHYDIFMSGKNLGKSKKTWRDSLHQ